MPVQLVDHRGNPLSSSSRGHGASAQEKALAKRYLSLLKSGRLRGSFDVAQTNVENRRHWENADALSADAAANPDVRRIVRNRSRYEVANNSYAKGICLSLVNDTIGTGPRLQMLSQSTGFNRWIEREFRAWAAAVSLAEKLRTMRMARVVDGEAFAIMRSNPEVRHDVKLDLALVEADRVTAPSVALPDDSDIDGIQLDEYGNPVNYRVLKSHPGSNNWNLWDDALTVEAADMIHLYRADRPGQHRGVTEILPALPLFANLRAFTLAVLAAAEGQAEHTGVIKTDQPPGGDADDKNYDPMEAIETERGMYTWLPYGWDAVSFPTSQPVTTYAEFKREVLTEIARCLNIPYNIAAGDSSRHNYASGRLDHQGYFKSIRVDQAFIGERCLDRILWAWLQEFVFVTPGLVGVILSGRLPQHLWMWDGREHVDPLKEEKAKTERVKNGRATLAQEGARDGVDWEENLDQLVREVEAYHKRGLRHPSEAPAQATAPAAAGGIDIEELTDSLAEAVAERLAGAMR